MDGLLDNLISLQTIVTTLGALGLIEFTPIKLNPISFVVRRLGNAWNSGVYQKIDSIEDSLKGLSTHIDSVETELLDEVRLRCKREILDFAGRCRVYPGRITNEEYDHIFQVERKYHDVVKRLGVTNGQVDNALEVIKEKYKQSIR